MGSEMQSAEGAHHDSSPTATRIVDIGRWSREAHCIPTIRQSVGAVGVAAKVYESSGRGVMPQIPASSTTRALIQGAAADN